MNQCFLEQFMHYIHFFLQGTKNIDLVKHTNAYEHLLLHCSF